MLKYIYHLLGRKKKVGKGSGVVKQILKDHFVGFWEMHSTRFPESYRNLIKETVEKTINSASGRFARMDFQTSLIPTESPPSILPSMNKQAAYSASLLVLSSSTKAFLRIRYDFPFCS